MTVAQVVLTCLLWIIVFVMFGALVEMYQQLAQVRKHLGMFDAPGPIDLGDRLNVAPSAVGLPGYLDGADQSVVLFLSNKCETCIALAEVLGGDALPPRLTLVIVPVFQGEAQQFIDRFQLHHERTIGDTDGKIVKQLKLDTTPVAIVVTDGVLERAQTVPTSRQLFTLLSSLRGRRPSKAGAGRAPESLTVS
jgi:hypothetical protein